MYSGEQGGLEITIKFIENLCQSPPASHQTPLRKRRAMGMPESDRGGGEATVARFIAIPA